MADKSQGITCYNLEYKSVPKNGPTETQYRSSSVLSKVGSGSARRAPQFELEKLKK